jgi:hypothetical protein
MTWAVATIINKDQYGLGLNRAVVAKGVNQSKVPLL